MSGSRSWFVKAEVHSLVGDLYRRSGWGCLRVNVWLRKGMRMSELECVTGAADGNV